MTSQSRTEAPEHAEQYSVVVIGAGFSGLNMAIRLKQSGQHDFVVLERANDLGGTWRDNVYPGCACDVPSVMYSYSFEQNPDWSAAFAGSDEIHRYLRRCAEKYGVLEHLRFSSSVVRAEFDEHKGSWTLHTEAGKRYVARVVVAAAGGLVNPSWPTIAGRERFKGKTIHTARWDRDYDLTGKRVAVIGTGASAIQVIPAIQKTVGSLKVLQRTPAWVIPKSSSRRSEAQHRLFKTFPVAQNLVRKTSFLMSELLLAPALILDSPLTKVLENMARQHLHRQVRDPVLRAKLTPDIRIGCKRLLISNHYYPALQAPNVELITDVIECFTERGIRTRDGREHELDAVVFATGFLTKVREAVPFEIRGLGGVTLSEVWKRPGSKGYKGVSVAGFPNWLMMLGPNTGPGHTSVLVYSEAQASYILQAIERVTKRGIKYQTVKQSVQDRYSKRIQARMPYTTWASGCASWYLDEHGENHALFPGLATEYVLSVRRFRDEEYEQVR